MAEKTIKALVEGGKATAGPPIGPALGPMGINAGQVVAEINKQTADFAGLTVPVTVFVDPEKKTYHIEVGMPSVSALMKKELLLEKGSGSAKEEKVGDATIDQLIKISRSKRASMHAKTDRAALKEVIGSCIPIGILVDGRDPRDVQKDVDSGKYDAKLSGKEKLVEVSDAEKRSKADAFKKAAEARAAKKKAEEEAAKAAAEAAAAAQPAAAGAEAKPGAAPAAGAATPAAGAKKDEKAEKAKK